MCILSRARVRVSLCVFVCMFCLFIMCVSFIMCVYNVCVIYLCVSCILMCIYVCTSVTLCWMLASARARSGANTNRKFECMIINTSMRSNQDIFTETRSHSFCCFRSFKLPEYSLYNACPLDPEVAWTLLLPIIHLSWYSEEDFWHGSCYCPFERCLNSKCCDPKSKYTQSLICCREQVGVECMRARLENGIWARKIFQSARWRPQIVFPGRVLFEKRKKKINTCKKRCTNELFGAILQEAYANHHSRQRNDAKKVCRSSMLIMT